MNYIIKTYARTRNALGSITATTCFRRTWPNTTIMNIFKEKFAGKIFHVSLYKKAVLKTEVKHIFGGESADFDHIDCVHGERTTSCQVNSGLGSCERFLRTVSSRTSLVHTHLWTQTIYQNFPPLLFRFTPFFCLVVLQTFIWPIQTSGHRKSISTLKKVLHSYPWNANKVDIVISNYNNICLHGQNNYFT